ncbi:unnamed protein product [Ascophyllum nodosum]
MAPLPPIAPPIITPDLPERQSVMRQQHLMTPQQLPIMHPPGGLVGSSSVFALTKMRDRLHHHAPLGGFSGGFSNPMSHSVDESQSAARTPRFTGLFQGKQTNKKLPMVTKMGAKTPVGLRSAHSNRKGSRHRLTPQAKDILEGWLAKHWLNPYPTEEEKIFLAQACKITVSQVNNWMMNVRVRRCRTKKIGVATGPRQITFADVPKAIEANMPQVRSSYCRADPGAARSLLRGATFAPSISGVIRPRPNAREESKSPSPLTSGTYLSYSLPIAESPRLLCRSPR